MANIRLHKDPLNPLKTDVVKANGAFIAWAMDNAPWAGAVMRNGVLLEHQTDFDMSEFDEIDVIAVPQGIELSWWVIGAIALGSAAVAYFLMPKPEIPNGAGEIKDSPNNRLNAATNSFRPRQAMPHIYGKVRAYPDYIQPSYYVYENNEKIFYETFLVGVGYLDVTEVKSSESPIDTFTVYQPDDTLPAQYDVRGTNEVDGQEIKPVTQTTNSIGLIGGTVADTNTISGVDTTNLDAGIGDTVTINNMTWNGGADTFSGTATISSIGLNQISFSDVTWNVSSTLGDITSGTASASAAVSSGFVLVGDSIEEIRYHLVAPQGLRDENGDYINIELELSYVPIDINGDPTGSGATKRVFIGGETGNPQYRTFSFTGLTPSRYRAQVERITNEFTNGADTINLEGIDSVTPLDTSKYGAVTTLSTVRRATTQATSGRSPKTNCIAQALLPIFDPNTGTFGARSATRSAAQAVMDVLVNKGGESLANIDYESLFDAVPTGELGYFDFTFDDKDVSVEQAVKTILNAARCYHYMVGNVWTFERDEAKPARSSLFNVRNTMPESVQQTYSFYRNQDFDSVEIRYVNPVDNSEAYVRRRINATTGAIEEGLGDYVNEIDLAGCRNATQAINRAELEIRKIKYLWLNATATVTSEGLLVGLGQKVGLVSINKTKVFAGEVLESLGGGVYRLSEPWTMDSGVTYYGYIVQSDGAVSTQVVVTQPAGEPYQVSAAWTNVAIANGYEIQQGSLYVIAPLTSMNAQDFTVVSRSKPDDKYNVTLELVNYDARVYELD